MVTCVLNEEALTQYIQYSHTYCFCRYRKVPSDKCEGGYSPQVAAQTVIRTCGIKPSPGPPASSSAQVTHFDAPVSGFVFVSTLYLLIYLCSVLRFITCFFQGERLVLILVCAGAGFIVLIAIVSAVFAVRRVVYRNR